MGQRGQRSEYSTGGGGKHKPGLNFTQGTQVF